jgi:hypothetical protein
LVFAQLSVDPPQIRAFTQLFAGARNRVSALPMLPGDFRRFLYTARRTGSLQGITSTRDSNASRRQHNWVDGIRQNSTITIAVKEPEVEHTVRIKDFEHWLASNGKSRAEQALKSDRRALIQRRAGEDKPVRRG